ncbi:flagellar hook-basal body protein [Desulfospira joergensenii]|uniref:flagellar hook-basal body protein n=1 Tax=Desulfospira joergensenii TaxID=53329 RepID=UPI0003B3FBEA|nr:flagellar hook-basal body protein [Desulfospira joergensenii]
MILEMTRPVQGGLRQERKLEAVSNNLANVDTSGYKKDVISFDKKFKAEMNKDYSQGDVTETGNPLDLALGGAGFFKIETDQGIQYTRNGTFTLDSIGTLVDGNGNPVLGQGGAIVIDLVQGQEPYINEAGEILVDGEIVDTLDIVTFADLKKLEKKAQNLFEYMGETTDEILPEIVSVKQRALETSNVQVVDEMVKMIDFHRMFETFTKSMLTFDEIDSKAVSEVGRPR